MPTSTRVPIAPNLSQSKDLETTRRNVDELAKLDTPQVLPKFAEIDKGSPGWLGMFLSFGVRSAFAALFWLVMLIIAAAWLVVFYIAVLQLRQPQPLFGVLWFVLGVVWAALFLYKSESVHAALSLKTLTHRYPLSTLVNLGLLGIRLAAWLIGFSFILLGVSTFVLVVLFGGQIATQLALSQLSAFNLPEWSPYVIVGLVLLISTALVYRGLWWPPLGILWGVGVYWLLERRLISFPLQIPSSQVPFEITFPFSYLLIALSGLLLLGIPHLSAHWSLSLFKAWQAHVILLAQAIRLRLALGRAYTKHRQRNRERVAADGEHAICNQDLEYFVSSRSGPVTYWWCPQCQDDHWVYARVRMIQGVLDTQMSVPHEQQDSVLRINLLLWRKESKLPPPLAMGELFFGKLDDPHEVEWFMTKYRLAQPKQRNWMPMQNIRPVIHPDSNVDEHMQRVIQGTFNQR